MSNLPIYMLLFSTCLTATVTDDPKEYFEIRIVDQQTGRGVPLVELRTVNGIRHFTDSGGYIAINSPELLNREIYFHIASHGYEFPTDKFGYRGRKLKVVPGGSAEIRIKRINIAQRMYRITGAGIYRDSLLLNKPIPVHHPLINAQVFGSDSVVNTIYRGKIYWFWGDTNRPNYPLGNFNVPGATSSLPEDGGLNPNQGVNLDYWLSESGFAKATAPMPGQGPTWINGLVVLKNAQGEEELLATYVKIKPPMKVYERGLIRFNDEKSEFELVKKFDMETPLFPSGHPLVHSDKKQTYIYFPNPYPITRVPANSQSLQDPAQYETYTYLKQGARQDSLEIERDLAGNTIVGWKTDTIPLTPKIEQELITSGKLQESDGLLQTKDNETDKTIQLHGGSVYWNPYRKRWVMIALQQFGHSLLGEIWYLESDSLTGPWHRARRIVSHDKYSFYNPKQHPMLSLEQGRYIFFEGTYTNMFSGNPDKTPRYDYNQIMYRLDLADPRLTDDSADNSADNSADDSADNSADDSADD